VPLAREGVLYLNICAGVPEFLVTPLLMGPICRLTEGRFKDPVSHWTLVKRFVAITA